MVRAIDVISRDLVSCQYRLEQFAESGDRGGIRLAFEDVACLIEELRTANNDLHAINQSLESRNEQLIRLNAEMAILSENADNALLLLDSDLRIETFTIGATRIFPLLPQDRGRRLTDFTNKLLDADLAADLECVLRTRATIEREIAIDTDHVSRALLMRIRPYPPVGGTTDGLVLSFFDAITSEYKLAAIVDSSEDAIIGKNLNNIVTSWNPGAERLFGYSSEEMLGKSIMLVVPDHLQQEDARILRRIARGDRIDPFETTRVRKDGTLVSISLAVSPVRNAQGKVVGASKIGRDITERKQAEEKLRKSEQELRVLVGALEERNTQSALAEKSALVGSFSYSVGTDTLLITEGYAAIHGFPLETREVARSAWLAGVHPEDRARLDELRDRAFCMRSSEYAADFRILRSGREVRWIEARAFVAYRGDGSPHRVVGVNIDVTDRKRAEEQLRSLNAELDHRVKNVLATVSAVAAQTVDSDRSVNAYVDALHGRLRSMASTHELLSHRACRGMSLAELLRRELAPYATDDNTQIVGPPITLSAEAGHAVAMVLHELTTNAAKYGALSSREGRVLVRWQRPANGNAHEALVIDWQETGSPSTAVPSKPGYGTSVIRDLVPYELGGSVDLVLAAEGLRCRLEIPAKWVSADIGQASAEPDSKHSRARQPATTNGMSKR
jgi:PAS domain S-box-containing protein